MLLAALTVANAQAPHIERDSHMLIEPRDGFENYLSAAILKKKVPVIVVVDDKSKADYVITGKAAVEQASWAKTIFVTPAPPASASIRMNNVKTGDLVFAYSADKFAAQRADQSTAEACAKHMKEAVDR